MARRRTGAEESSREMIINAAMKLFSEKGYERTSIQDIVKQTGLSVGTIYFYFKNKKNILKEIILRFKPVFRNINKYDISGFTFVEYLKFLGRKTIEFLSSHLGLHLLIINESIKDSKLAAFFHENFTDEISDIAVKMREYSQREGLKNVDYEKITINFISTILSAVIFGAMFKNHFTPNYLDELLENLIDVNAAGLARKKGWN